MFQESLNLSFPDEKVNVRVKQKGKKEVQGTVVEALPNTTFRVELGDGKLMLCHLSGRMRRFRIKVMPGDKVKVETTPYDKNRGRIVYRLK